MTLENATTINLSDPPRPLSLEGIDLTAKLNNIRREAIIIDKPKSSVANSSRAERKLLMTTTVPTPHDTKSGRPDVRVAESTGVDSHRLVVCRGFGLVGAGGLVSVDLGDDVVGGLVP